MKCDFMEITRSLCCKELRKIDVIDSTGEKIGRIGDLTFPFDGDLKLAQFILAGPRFEEFLEAIKVKPDRDPVFDVSLIKKISDKIHLDTTADTLKTTLDDCAISDDEIRLSKLEKLDIFDKDGNKGGNIKVRQHPENYGLTWIDMLSEGTGNINFLKLIQLNPDLR